MADPTHGLRTRTLLPCPRRAGRCYAHKLAAPIGATRVHALATASPARPRARAPRAQDARRAARRCSTRPVTCFAAPPAERTARTAPLRRDTSKWPERH